MGQDLGEGDEEKGEEEEEEEEDDTIDSRRFLPMRSLRSVLYLLFPEILFIEKNLQGGIYHRNLPQGDLNWIYSRKKIDTSHIAQVIRAWIRVEWDNPLAEQYAREHITTSALAWEKILVQVPFPSEVSENNTALLDPNAYSFLVDYLAEEFLRDVREIPLAQMAEFYRVTIPDLPNTIRLISRPVRSGKKMWSYRIDLSYQTVPFCPIPLLYLKGGIMNWGNNWAPEHRLRSMSFKFHSIYLISKKRFGGSTPLDEVGTVQDHMTTARIKKTSKPSEDGSGNLVYSATWRGRLGEILSLVSYEVPTPEDIIMLPKGISHVRDTGFEVFISRGTGDYGTFGLVTGFENISRCKILRAIGNYFTSRNFLKIEDPYEPIRVKGVPSVSGMHDRLKTDKDRLLSNLCDSRPDNAEEIYVEVFAGSIATFETIVGECRRLLQIEPLEIREENTVPFLIQSPKSTFRLLLRYRPASNIVELVPATLIKKGKIAIATEKHLALARKIATKLGKAQSPTVAMIELRDVRKDRQCMKYLQDPKEAIRYGLALSGRLSQFLTPLNSGEKSGNAPQEQEDEDDEIDLAAGASGGIRAAHALLDALRQLGFNFFKPLPLPRGLFPTLFNEPPKLATGIEDDSCIFDYYGLWQVRMNRNPKNLARGYSRFPLLIHVDGGTGKIFAAHCVSDGNPRWLPYYQFLLELALTHGDLITCQQFTRPRTSRKEENQSIAARRLLAEIQNSCGTHQPVLFVNALNMRSIWGWLKNNAIKPTTADIFLPSASDNIPYELDTDEKALESLKKCILIRSREDEEDPFQYGLRNVDSNCEEKPTFPNEAPEEDQVAPSAFSFREGILRAFSYSRTGEKTSDTSQVFFDIARRPAMLQHLPPDYQHGSTRGKPWKSQIAIELTIITPRVLSQDEITLFAYLHRYARFMALTFKEYLNKGYPLHLAEKSQEYIFNKFNDV